MVQACDDTRLGIWHGLRDGSTRRVAYANYDFTITVKIMTLLRWPQIKTVLKLSNNITFPGRRKEGINPESKHNFIICKLCHSMNYFMLQAELDTILDKSMRGNL